jgi:hypothetical protein
MPECFIIMPITTPNEFIASYGDDRDHFKHVLEHLFVPALEKIGYTPIPPAATGAEVIHAEIIKSLETADLVLCDMSTLNANVFFELGIRTAVDKPVCLVKDQLTNHVPFDTTLINYHTYDYSLALWTMKNEIQSLSEHLFKSLNKSDGRNSLWRYFGLTSRGSAPRQSSTSEEKLDAIIQMLQETRQSPERITAPPKAKTSTKDIVEWIVRQAHEIAGELKAELSVKEASDKKVVFDLGNYMLSEDRIGRIKELGREYEIPIELIAHKVLEDGKVQHKEVTF